MLLLGMVLGSRILVGTNLFVAFIEFRAPVTCMGESLGDRYEIQSVNLSRRVHSMRRKPSNKTLNQPSSSTLLLSHFRCHEKRIITVPSFQEHICLRPRRKVLSEGGKGAVQYDQGEKRSHLIDDMPLLSHYNMVSYLPRLSCNQEAIEAGHTFGCRLTVQSSYNIF